MSQSDCFHFIPRRILLPIDFSAPSSPALETATELAQYFHAELYLLDRF